SGLEARDSDRAHPPRPARLLAGDRLGPRRRRQRRMRWAVGHVGREHRDVCDRRERAVFVDGEVVHLHPGEELLVAPGVVHQPFNPTEEEAVVLGPLTPEYALPERFGIFLSQAYGFFDAAPENGVLPRALLQMSRFSPAYDSWLGGPPVALQRALYWVLGPIARLLGYRSYYPRYAPGP
ncbi:MAG: hypothetical protein O6826_09700, partial [Acidobacteria bacterium]|nr:hypothetical protein [Acidobacteriota bacterium]